MSMGFSDTSVPGTWKLEGEQVRATLKHADGAEGDMIFTSNGDGTITATSPYGDSNGDLIVFAKSAEGAMDVPVDVTKAKAPTQASQVVGSWKTVGVVMGKVYAEGDNLSQTGSPTISLDLKEDGAGTISYGDSYSASDTKWEIASGACTFEESGKKYNLLVSGD